MTSGVFSLKISDLEKRIEVLEAQLKREINCSYCQKNRFIQKWLDKSTSTNSDSSKTSRASEQLKRKSSKRKLEFVDEDDSPINVNVCHQNFLIIIKFYSIFFSFFKQYYCHTKDIIHQEVVL